MTPFRPDLPDQADPPPFPGPAAADPAAIGPAMLWQARHPGPSPFLRQTPLLFWLTEVLRPSTVLGLGLRSGESYLALCQAIDLLGLTARAWGFGDWQDEEGAPAAAGVPAPLRAQNAARYGAFSRLGQAQQPAGALARFEAGTLDLVLLDSRSLSGDGQDLALRLLQLAAPRGVLLVQGSTAAEGPARALLARLCASHPSLVLATPDAGPAATLVLTGPRPEARLKHLAALRPDAAERVALHAEITRLGDLQAQAWHSQSAERRIAAQQATAAAEADQARARIAALEETCAAQARALAEAQEAARSAIESAAAAAKAAEAAAETVPADRLRALAQEAQALRLRDSRILTEELERLSEELRLQRLESAQALAEVTETAARDTAEAAAAAQAELASLRIRHFDLTEDLRADIAWLERDLEATRSAAAEARAAAQATAETETARLQAELAALTATLTDARAAMAGLEAALTAAQGQIRAEQARGQAAAAEAARALAAQADQASAAAAAMAASHAAALRKMKAAQARLEADLAAERQARARAAALARVQLGLRVWQVERLQARGRLGAVPGPAGGRAADELARLRRHPLFDAAWYKASHADVATSGLDPAEHFLRHGFYEGRNPGPRLDLLAWFLARPEALAARQSPLDETAGDKTAGDKTARDNPEA